MAEIGVGRLNRGLQKLLDMKADPPAPDLAGEVMPVQQLEIPGPEYAYPLGVKLGGTGGQLAAVAAQPNLLRIRNPATSGILAIIESVVLGSTATHTVAVRIGQSATTLGTGVTLASRDQRFGGGGSSALIMSADQTGAATVGNPIGRIRIPANGTTPPIPINAVLSPGDSLDLAGDTNNVLLDFQVHWRERAREDSER